MTLAKKKDDILYWALVGLILYMPLHYYLCELLVSGTSVDNILRDGVILLLTCMTWFYRKRLPATAASWLPAAGRSVSYSCVLLLSKRFIITK